MTTYRVMLTNDETKLVKVSIIVASCESQAMQFAELINRGYSAQFCLKMFAGSPGD
jgi:hypothetical protein